MTNGDFLNTLASRVIELKQDNLLPLIQEGNIRKVLDSLDSSGNTITYTFYNDVCRKALHPTEKMQEFMSAFDDLKKMEEISKLSGKYVGIIILTVCLGLSALSSLIYSIIKCSPSPSILCFHLDSKGFGSPCKGLKSTGSDRDYYGSWGDYSQDYHDKSWGGHDRDNGGYSGAHFSANDRL